jgi:hypothetical protein
MELPYDPAIPLLGIYLKEYKTGYNKGTCTLIFITTLFTTGKLPSCPTTDQCKYGIFDIFLELL